MVGDQRTVGFGRSTTAIVRLGAILSVVMMASACSTLGLSSDGDDGPQGGPTTALADTTVAAADDETGDDIGTDTDTGAEPVDERVGADLWTAADDAVFLPDAPQSSPNDVLAPVEDGQPWVVAGSIFDFEASRSAPTVWELSDPAADWQPTTLDISDGASSAWISDLERFNGREVAVGGSGSDEDRRPAVWVRTGDDAWTPVVDPALDRGESSWLSTAVVDPSGERLVVLGRRLAETAETEVVIWLSDDGATFAPAATQPAQGDSAVSLTVGTPGIVVVGSARTDGEPVATGWFSVDGSSWDEVSLPAPGALRSAVDSVTWFEGRFVAVGSVADGPQWEPASWTSDDGVIWSPDGGTFEPVGTDYLASDGFGASGVVVTGDRLLATTSAGFVQEMWESTNGSRWAAVPDLRSVHGSGPRIVSMAGAQDTVVALTDEPAALVFDGGWSRVVPDAATVPTATMTPVIGGLTATDDRFVVVGGFRDASDELVAGAWSSVDGKTWEELPEPPGAAFGPMTGVSPTGGGLVVSGYETIEATDLLDRGPRGTMWTLDGDEWDLHRDDLFGDNGERRLFFDAASISVGTEDGTEGDTDGGTEDGTEGDTDGIVLVGTSFGVATDGLDALLLESDGTDWREVDTGLDGPDDQRFDSVCAGDDGTAIAVAEATDGGNSDVVILARSADGSWTEAELPAPDPSVLSREASACVHDENGYAVAGWTSTDDEEDVLFWTSPDGRTWSAVAGSPGSSAGSDQWAVDVIATDEGYLLLGSDEIDGVRQTVLWLGSGSTWQRLELPPDTDGMSDTEIAEVAGTVAFGGWNGSALKFYWADLAALAEATATAEAPTGS